MRMTKKIFCLMAAMLLVAGFAASSFGHGVVGTSFCAGSGSEWSDSLPGNFCNGVVPGCHTNVVINQGRVVYIGTVVTNTPNNIRLDNGAWSAVLIITNGSFSVEVPGNSCDGSTGFVAPGWRAGSYGLLDVQGGDFTAGTLRIAANNHGNPETGTLGEVYVSGGSLTFSDGHMGVWNGVPRGYATFKIVGTGADFIQGESLLVGTNSTLRFELDATGVDVIDVSGGAVTLAEGSSLEIDGTLYTGGSQIIELVKYNTLANQFAPSAVTISGFPDLTGTIQYDGDSINLLLTVGTPIIGVFVRNGHFGDDAGAGPQTYADTTYWENIGSGSQSDTARDDTPTVASGHCLVTTSDAGRITAQNTGYTFREGDEFSVSYEWQDGANWEQPDDQVEVSLFMTDDDTITGTQTVLTNFLSGVSAVPAATQSAAAISELTPASFAGKRLFVSIDVSSGNGDSDDVACVDDFVLTVTNRVDIPTLSEWGMILLFAGLLFFAYRKLSRQQGQPAAVGAAGGAPA